MIFIFIFFLKTHKETLVKPEFGKIFSGILSYIGNSLSSILSFYGEIIAFEWNTYMSALLYDIILLDAWVATINYSAVYFCSSIGFSFAIRNLVGHTLGQKKAQ